MTVHIPDCEYNRSIGCSLVDRKCEKCGWNPEVDAVRREKTRERLAKEALVPEPRKDRREHA